MDAGLLRARASGQLAAALCRLPAPVLRAACGAPPPEAAGLAPDAWLLARLSRLEGDPDDEVPVATARRRADAQGLPLSPRLARHVAAADQTDAPVPVRLYTPAAAAGAAGPLLVFFHGGGWVQRSVDTHDAALRLLAERAAVRIASVEYRLAPEHPFPAPLDDAQAAYAHIAQHPAAYGAEAGRVAVGGDSAGGNLAAVVARLARDGAAPPPCFQFLLYPVCDVPGAHPSYDTFADGFSLTAERMAWFFDAYVPDASLRADPRVSPARATDLAGLAPAHVTTALADPLRDEGEAYAARLREAGVPVTLQRHPLLHGFLNQTAARSARESVLQVAGVLRQALG